MMKKEKRKNIRKSLLYKIEILIFLLAYISDHLSKLYAIRNLKDKPSMSIIDGVLELHFLENDGAAFGLLNGQISFFIFVTIIVFLTILYVLIKIPGKKKFVSASILLTLIAAGAIGNLSDRLVYKKVVDFIYISAIRFPIFNVADIYVTISSFLLLILVFFYYKEEDLNFLRIKEKKLRDV